MTQTISGVEGKSSSSKKNVIEVKNLVKRYGNFTAVNDITFSVREGSLFAFLGPNGAGKSTTINILTTFLDYQEGHISVLGCEAKKNRMEIRRNIGAVFQDSVLDKFLTVKENIKSRAALYGIKGAAFDKKYAELSEQFSLYDIENKRFDSLSGGQKRRTDIARALVNTPKILFLDEPSTGLDPQTRVSVWATVRKIQREHNVTVFLTTHYMEEASMADYVVMMDHGKIIAEDQPEGLINRFSSSKIRLKPLERAFYENFESDKYKFIKKNGTVTIYVKDCFEALKLAEKYKKEMEFFEIFQGNMDDVFLELTGRELREK